MASTWCTFILTSALRAFLPPFYQHLIPLINKTDIATNIRIYHKYIPALDFCVHPWMGGWFCCQRAACRPIGLYFGQPYPPPCAQLYFGLYFGQLAQRPANDVSDRNWGDGGRVGVISDEKVINFHHSPNLKLVSYSLPSPQSLILSFAF